MNYVDDRGLNVLKKMTGYGHKNTDNFLAYIGAIIATMKLHTKRTFVQVGIRLQNLALPCYDEYQNEIYP